MDDATNIKPRIYLDMCCYNRPFDDQRQQQSTEIGTEDELQNR